MKNGWNRLPHESPTNILPNGYCSLPSFTLVDNKHGMAKHRASSSTCSKLLNKLPSLISQAFVSQCGVRMSQVLWRDLDFQPAAKAPCLHCSEPRSTSPRLFKGKVAELILSVLHCVAAGDQRVDSGRLHFSGWWVSGAPASCDPAPWHLKITAVRSATHVSRKRARRVTAREWIAQCCKMNGSSWIITMESIDFWRIRPWMLNGMELGSLRHLDLIPRNWNWGGTCGLSTLPRWAPQQGHASHSAMYKKQALLLRKGGSATLQFCVFCWSCVLPFRKPILPRKMVGYLKWRETPFGQHHGLESSGTWWCSPNGRARRQTGGTCPRFCAHQLKSLLNGRSFDHLPPFQWSQNQGPTSGNTHSQCLLHLHPAPSSPKSEWIMDAAIYRSLWMLLTSNEGTWGKASHKFGWNLSRSALLSRCVSTCLSFIFFQCKLYVRGSTSHEGTPCLLHWTLTPQALNICHWWLQNSRDSSPLKKEPVTDKWLMAWYWKEHTQTIECSETEGLNELHCLISYQRGSCTVNAMQADSCRSINRNWVNCCNTRAVCPKKLLWKVHLKCGEPASEGKSWLAWIKFNVKIYAYVNYIHHIYIYIEYTYIYIYIYIYIIYIYVCVCVYHQLHAINNL